MIDVSHDSPSAHPLATRGLYVPLDVNYADNPKVMRLSTIEAELLYVRSLAFAKRIGSDGRIHHEQLWKLTGDLPSVAHEGRDAMELVNDLVRCGLWLIDGDAWAIDGWSKWNLTAEELAERRTGKSRGGSLGNHRRWHEGRGVVDPDCEHCASLTDPTTESDKGSDSESTETERERETSDRSPSLMPPKFAPSAEVRDFYATRLPHVDFDACMQKFVSWHKSKGTQSADWQAEAKLWGMREEAR